MEEKSEKSYFQLNTGIKDAMFVCNADGSITYFGFKQDGIEYYEPNVKLPLSLPVLDSEIYFKKKKA